MKGFYIIIAVCFSFGSQTAGFPVNETRSASDAQVKAVREKFLAGIVGQEDKFDARDIKRVKEENWFVERFVSTQRDNDYAVDALRDTLLWKQANRVNDVQLKDIPKEYFDMGITYLAKDKAGTTVVYHRLKHDFPFDVYHDIPLLVNLYLYNKFADNANGNGMAIVMDLTGAGPSNVDLSLAPSIIPRMRHYPTGLKYVWVHEMPWYLRPIATLALAFVPTSESHLIKLVNRQEATELMGERFLPPFMGGKGLSMVEFKAAPDAIGYREMGAKRGFSNYQMDRFESYYKRNLQSLADEKANGHSVLLSPTESTILL